MKGLCSANIIQKQILRKLTSRLLSRESGVFVPFDAGQNTSGRLMSDLCIDENVSGILGAYVRSVHKYAVGASKEADFWLVGDPDLLKQDLYWP